MEKGTLETHIRERKTVASYKKGISNGPQWEDLDIIRFLSTTHVFVIPYLLNAYFMLSTNSQCPGHSSEQGHGSALAMEHVCYWNTMDSKQTPTFLLVLLSKVGEILLGSSET